MMRRLTFSASVMAAVLCLPASATEDWTVGKAVKAVIADAIRPAFSNYEIQTMGMSASMDALCAEPGPVTLAEARDQFTQVASSWGQAEFMRIGPLANENRLERTQYWPDRKGRGLRQVRIAIAQEQEPVVAVETLSRQSVAVQGLLALEFVLFGDESGMLETGAVHRCAYGKAISGNLSNIAAELSAEWSDDGSFVDLWLNPSPDNPLFRDADEQLRTLLKLVSEGTEIISVQRVDPFLNSEPFNPKRAMYWRSGSTISSLQGNIKGLRLIVDAAQLGEINGGENRRTVDGLDFEISNAERTLAATQIKVEALADDSEAFGRLKYFRIVMQSMSDLSGSTIPGIFGLTSGFSSLDGD